MPAGKHLMGGAAYARHLRACHKALGLCRFCSRKSAPQRTACEKHLAYMKAWKAARRQKVAA